MDANATSHKQDLTALGLLVALLLWFNHETLLTGKVPFFRDLGLIFYPMRFSVAESLRAGALPLWNRHMGMGFPLMANFQSEAFYPPNLVFLAFPFFSAVRAIFLFHYLVAAAGSYLLCRRWGYDCWLAVIGALLFTLGGTLVSLSNLLNHFQAAVWLPWLILFWERYLERPCWKNLLVLLFVSLLQFLAGSPEFYVMTTCLVCLDFWRLRSTGCVTGVGKFLLAVLAVNVLTLALAMVQVLPTLELVRESRSKFPLPLELASSWSLKPSDLLNLFFLDKEAVMDRPTGMEMVFAPDLPFFVTHYMGAFSLIGLALWCYYASRKEKSLLAILVIAALLLSFGGRTPLFPALFRHVPGFALFRFPEKFFFLVYGILIYQVLKGFGALLQAGPSAPRIPLVIFSCITLGLTGLYLGFRMDAPLLGRFISYSTRDSFLSNSTIHKAAWSLFSIERQLILTLAIIGLAIVRIKGVIRSGLFNVLIVAVVFLDLHSAHAPYQHLVKPDFVDNRTTILAPPGHDRYRIFYYPHGANLHPSYYALPRKVSFAEFSSLAFRNLLPNTGLFHGFDYMQELDALIREPYNIFLAVGNRLPYDRLINLLAALNVRYVYSFQPLPLVQRATLERQSEGDLSWVYRIGRVLPRTYVVGQIEQEQDPVKILTTLADPGFDSSSTVMLDQGVPLPATDHFTGHAGITRYENEIVTIEASLNSPGMLVLADSYYPGWHAYVDGKPQKIYRANLFFRAVALPEGRHVVVFRYEPRSFTIGLIISLMTICGLVLLSGYFYFRGREPRRR